MSEMPATGQLQDEPLPLLLHQLFAHQSTGVLRLEARVGRHDVFVREGYPVAVTLPGSAELLGKVLVEMGILDEQTHKQTLAHPPPRGMKYGEWLVQQQLVTVEHMRLALKAQVRRKLHRLFFLNEAQFVFAPGEHHQGIEQNESLRIHPARAIYQGVRSAWNAERLAGALFLLEGRAIKCVLDDAGVARYGAGKEDARVAELLRKGFWTVPDLIDAAGLPVQPVHALVYSLYVTETLEVCGADEVPRLRRKSDSQNSVAAPLPRRESVAAPLPRRESVAAPLPRRESVAAPLPTRPDTPPRGNSESSTNLPPPRQPSSPNLTPPRHPSSPSLTPRVPAHTPRGVPAIDVQGSGAHLLPTDPAVIRRMIEAKAKVVDGENLFAVLGLAETAGRDEIKAAYFEAAKRYHPDRLSVLGLEALRPDVERIFRRVSEAYGTLHDDKRREDYRQALSRPPEEGESPEAHAKAMKLLDAEMAFRRGEQLARKNDFAGALKELEQAVAGNPQEGEHVAWLAFARVGAGQATWAEAKQRLAEATKLSPKCARAFYFLGMALKEEHDDDRALLMFRKAFNLDERLLEAEREIRLITMRKEKSSGGWFSKKK